MDEFPGLLERDFGFRPQGKSAPMASSRGAGSGTSSASVAFAPSYSSFTGKSGRESFDFGDPSSLDEVSGMYGSRSFQDHGGGVVDLDDIFAGTSKRPNSHLSSSSLNYDSVLGGLKDSASEKNPSAPVYDKPVYDDDIFDGIPGLKSSSNTTFDDVFAQMSSSSNHTTPPFEDLLGTLSGKEPKSSVLGDKPSTTAPPFDDLLGIGTKGHIPSRLREKPSSCDKILVSLGEKEHNSSDLKEKPFKETAPMSMPAFDDLIPGFDGRSPPSKRNLSQAAKSQTSSTTTQSASTTSHDPFIDLKSTTIPVNSSSGVFVDPLEGFNATSASKKNGTISNDAFSAVNGFNVSFKKEPTISSDLNGVSKNHSSLETPHGTINEYSASVNEYSRTSTAWNSVDTSPKKVTVDSHPEPAKGLFDIGVCPSQAAPLGRSGSQFAYVNSNQDKINKEQQSETVNDIWLTVSEIPLFTLPTTAPPPSRPPPPLMPKRPPFSYNDEGVSLNMDSKRKTAFDDISSDFHNDSYKTFGVSSLDELEEFAKKKHSATGQSEVLSNDEYIEINSAAATSAAAMKEAMDRAEAKFRHARELREREKESKSGKAREFVDLGPDFPNQENAENLGRLEREQEEIERDMKEKEREVKEKEQKRLEREREREIAREKAAVERALREARERAAVEARQKAERAAVQKANAEARERAARASVPRATAEARERAAAEARERAAAESRERAAAEARERAVAESRERAAAEARERAATEAKERAAREVSEREYREREAKLKAAAMTRERERAAVQRAAADARARAERAAVERAHAEARERAAAAAREKLHKTENDLDSIFGMGTRANSEPKQRASTMDSPFDTQVRNKGGAADGMRGASSSSSMKKASSSTNFLDDLNSVFGAAASSGEFQEIDGESEERRKARLDRHQRTLERAAKALAEKNERDNQIQREQAERHRIAETLDVEIKRWAAGKEGNLRALLSTLQYVLWPECGWQPVSLTDLITSVSVKKVYRKATLCIHPDKVQQKGATLQQKYIAEKVFDLLKEAWNKFNSEELF